MRVLGRLFCALVLFFAGVMIFESMIGGLIFLVIAFVVPFTGPGYAQSRGYK